MNISKEIAAHALEEIARRNGVTAETVRREIKLAMLAGMCSQDPKVQEKWKSIPCEGEVPTPEEMISYIAGEIVR